MASFIKHSERLSALGGKEFDSELQIPKYNKNIKHVCEIGACTNRVYAPQISTLILNTLKLCMFMRNRLTHSARAFFSSA